MSEYKEGAVQEPFSVSQIQKHLRQKQVLIHLGSSDEAYRIEAEIIKLAEEHRISRGAVAIQMLDYALRHRSAE